MKTRRKFIDNVKQVYAQHTDAIQITGALMFLIVLFISGFLVSWNCIEIPLNDSQFEFCEQVARDVYAQEGQGIVEAPEDVTVSKTTSTITVEPTNFTHRGKVTAKLQNGELVMTRDFATVKSVLLSTILSIFFVFVFISLLMMLTRFMKMSNGNPQ